MPTILIIDDDDQIRTLLTQLLSDENDCTAVESAERALAVLDEKRFDLVISEINMPGISGLELVPRVLERNADAVVIMASGQQTIDSAIEALRVGAFDYVTKPLNIDHIEAAVGRALSHRRLLRDKRQYENRLEKMVRDRTAELEYLAYHDKLTGLQNRTLFIERCNAAVAGASNNRHLAGVVLVALDRFKNINDTLGHLAADELLKHVALRLQTVVNGTAAVARFEGAEFAILLSAIADIDEAEKRCHVLRDVFKRSFEVASQEVYLTASIGISLTSDHCNGASILQNAGAALHRAKIMGGNNYQFYKADMNASALTRLSLETNLRRAIDNDEFVTFYQPVVDLSSRDIVGVEALVRWHHPQRGLLAPGEFLDLAETTGLIVDISEWVLRTACSQTLQWQGLGCRTLRAAVNVSARHFRQKDFVSRIVQIVGETGLSPQSLELELTESSIMDNPESAAEILREIRSLGISIAIDDFGTGYSSMSYLKRFAVDRLKIDRSFTHGVATDPQDAAMVRAMITLAHDLGLRVVAEGVESKAQLSYLAGLGCDEGQGYLFAKPERAELVRDMLFDCANIHLRSLKSSAS